jgi:RNA polymerase sigma-70 factor, ECF subfamily
LSNPSKSLVKDWSSYSDPELIQAVRNGHQQAFTALVERHRRMVARTVISMVEDREEAEDIGQEVFIRFYKSLSDFRGDSKVGTYLTRIAINLSLNALKSRKRRSQIFRRNDDYVVLAEPGDDSEGSERSDLQEALGKALQKLDPKFRQIIVLRLIDGYSVKESAEILQLPEGTVLSRLARAQERMRELLKPMMG